MTKHTPGPWIMNCESIFQENAMGNVVMIASCGGSALKHEEQLANAQLISAAPEMLEALKAVYEDWGNAGLSEECYQDVGKAIAKAKGSGQ